MESKYKVKYLHHINPYFIWLKNHNDVIWQVGLYGLIPPQNAQIDEWPAFTICLLSQTLAEAEEVYFTPITIVDKDDNQASLSNGGHIFGELKIKLSSAPDVIDIGKLLYDKNVALLNIPVFKERKANEQLKLQLTRSQIEQVTLMLAARPFDEISESDVSDSSLSTLEKNFQNSEIAEGGAYQSIDKINSCIMQKKLNQSSKGSNEPLGTNKPKLQETPKLKPRAGFETPRGRGKQEPLNKLTPETNKENQQDTLNNSTLTQYIIQNKGCHMMNEQTRDTVCLTIIPAGGGLSEFPMKDTPLNIPKNGQNFDVERSLSSGDRVRITRTPDSLKHQEIRENNTKEVIPKLISDRTEPQLHFLNESVESRSTISDSERSVNTNLHRRAVRKPFTNPASEVRAHATLEDYGVAQAITAPKVMVHSMSGTYCQPWLNMASSVFSANVLKKLTALKIDKPYQIQSAAWPYIMRNDSVFIVNSKENGKTTTYAPAICSLLEDEEVYEDLPLTHGPLCVVVCADTYSVVKTRDLFSHFLKNKRAVLGILPDDRYVDNEGRLFNGCDVLVSTPFCLSRILSGPNSSCLDFNRLVHFVVDDADSIDRRCRVEFAQVFAKCLHSQQKRKSQQMKLQVVVTSTSWGGLIKSIVKKSLRPVVCIGNLHECIVYSNGIMNIQILENCRKAQTVVDMINKIKPPFSKTVIMCNVDAEVADVTKLLKSQQRRVFSCHSSTIVARIADIRSEWLNCADDAIMICCDTHVLSLSITNANTLIHYSLPDTLKAFSFRFSVLIKNYRSIFDDDTSQSDIVVNLLIDEDNRYQLPRVIALTKRCNINVSKEVEDVALQVSNTREQSKAKFQIPICDEIANFGTCNDSEYCKQRHIIVPEFDTPPNWVPRIGLMKFDIIYFKTVSHFTARITEYNSQKVPSAILNLSLKMSRYYNDEKRLHGTPHVGDLCAVESRPKEYVRCKILHLFYKNSLAKSATIKYIDYGKTVTVDVGWLLYLPPQFIEIRTHIVDVRLCGFMPLDGDSRYADHANAKMKAALANYRSFRGSVELALGDCVWIEKFQAIDEHSDGSIGVLQHFNSYILNNCLAAVNPDHMKKLTELYVKFKMELPKRPEIKTKMIVKKTHLPKPQWAYLEVDKPTDVYFNYAESADQFYLTIAKWRDRVDILERDIQKYVQIIDADDSVRIDVGDYCLAMFPDDRLYYRARVEDIVHSKYDCFFVDHGDRFTVDISDIRPINERLITQLPFQAVECRLIGIKPFKTDMSVNCLENLCFENDHSSKNLSVTFFIKEAPKCTNGHKYAIVLTDKNKEIINDLLVEKNMALRDDTEYRYIEKVKKPASPVDDDDNLASPVDVDDNLAVEASEDESYEGWDVQFDQDNWLALINQTNGARNEPHINQANEMPKPNLPMITEAPKIPNLAKSRMADKDDDFEIPPPHLNHYRLPSVKWHQNAKHIIIKIDVPAIEQYTVKVTSRKVDFNCTRNGDEYRLHLNLYGTIFNNSDYYSHEHKGLYIVVKLQKILSKMWPFLTQDDIKPKHISYNTDHKIDDDSDTETVDDNNDAEILKYCDSDNSMDDEAPDLMIDGISAARYDDQDEF